MSSRMNPYDFHKHLINVYALKNPGDTKKIKERDQSKWKSDKDIYLKKMKFLWSENEHPESFEEQLAWTYYQKLNREYCICDLSRYKENQIANRFRVEKEIISAKGQFICGEKSCPQQEGLRTWEVNFAYVEDSQRKNALVKLRLCPGCSDKLNYFSKKREVKRLKKSKDRPTKVYKREHTESKDDVKTEPVSSPTTSHDKYNIGETSEMSNEYQLTSRTVQEPLEDENLWKKTKTVDTKDRNEEFDDYLADLLL